MEVALVEQVVVMINTQEAIERVKHACLTLPNFLKATLFQASLNRKPFKNFSMWLLDTIAVDKLILKVPIFVDEKVLIIHGLEEQFEEGIFDLEWFYGSDQVIRQWLFLLYCGEEVDKLLGVKFLCEELGDWSHAGHYESGIEVLDLGVKWVLVRCGLENGLVFEKVVEEMAQWWFVEWCQAAGLVCQPLYQRF